MFKDINNLQLAHIILLLIRTGIFLVPTKNYSKDKISPMIRFFLNITSITKA